MRTLGESRPTDMPFKKKKEIISDQFGADTGTELNKSLTQSRSLSNVAIESQSTDGC